MTRLEGNLPQDRLFGWEDVDRTTRQKYDGVATRLGGLTVEVEDAPIASIQALGPRRFGWADVDRTHRQIYNGAVPEEESPIE